MIITRKIEIYVAEENSKQKKEFVHTLYEWRDLIRKAANMIICHKFVQQNIRDFAYMQEDILERFMQENPEKVEEKNGEKKAKFYVSDVLKSGKGMSEQNTTYRLLSSMLKGKVPADIFSCLNQAVSKTFKETYGDILKGKASLRSYKNNIPMPFSAKVLESLHKAKDNRYYFTWFGIPFCCRLGHDRSNNAVMIDRCLEGKYKICTSSIAFEKRYDKESDTERQKLYLYLCIDVPKQKKELNEKKVMTARLTLETPIVCSCDVQAKQKIDSGTEKIEIGTREEFLHRRIQIQQKLRRAQIGARYCKGGKGRKKKLRLIEMFHLKEKNYIEYKMHVYSRRLVDLAVRMKAATIYLTDQNRREEEAKLENKKGNPFLLRNWSYYGLKEKIAYKAKRFGIKILDDKPKSKSEEETFLEDNK